MPQADRNTEIDRRLSEMRRGKATSGILLDFDGTLSEIAPRPGLARIHAAAPAELVRLADVYAVVAVISGRSSEELAGLVGVEGPSYMGLYGIEGPAALPDGSIAAVEALAASVSGAWVERKGITATVHVRGATDPAGAALELSRALSELAPSLGLEVLEGKLALELVPAGRPRKDGAVRRLVREHGLRAALYAGDDTADMEAFGALDELERDDGVSGLRVAVAGPETPDDLIAAADLTVDGPSGLVQLLSTL